MLPPLFRIETILAACSAKELILTANQRLKSKALQAWGLHQQNLGQHSWQAPRLLTLEQWLASCWQLLQAQAYPDSNWQLASAEQQRVLWEGITADCGLMQPEVIAQQAASGLRALERWQLPLSSLNEFDDLHTAKQSGLDSDGSDDKSKLYRQWCETFKRELKRKQLITPEDSYRIIGEAFSKNLLPKEAIIHLVGFDDIPPLLQHQLEHASAKLTTVDLNDKQPKTQVRTSFANSDSEMAAVAEWAKDLIEKQPESRLGIIVPNLGQCRDKIERALINSFESHSLLPEVKRYTYPFNISAGTPLGDTPLIHTAFELLKLTQQNWQVESLCQLLFSPFWGELDKEREQRYQLASKLEALGVFKINLSQLRYWAEKFDAQQEVNCEVNNLFPYFNKIKELGDNFSRSTKKHLPSEWVNYFLEHLSQLNWPGERQPDSHEYQQTQLWYELLEDFCRLDNTLGKIDSYTAIKECQQMAKHRPFQAQVPDSPIQVLGILEGAGLHFSHCWVLGLHQQAWPPSPQPNPLLPLQLQRQHNMPHASSLRELSFAKSLTDNYRHCADHVIFSSPEYDEDSEQLLLCSQLISDLPKSIMDINESNDFLRYSQQLQASQLWQSIECSKGPKVSPDDLNDQGELSGGANIIKAQATNPFDAFAIYRLGARPPLLPVNGFSAIEKGNILHQALAIIWETLESQQALLHMEENALSTLVQTSVDAQIQDLQRKKPQHLGKHLCQLESERQSHLILQWLNKVEKSRPAFTVVAIEESCQLNLQGHSFTLRLDRVDQLSDGSYLIIDYKSGTTSTADWQGERPRDPQLPLYLISRQETVSAIAFAEVNVQKQRFNGACSGLENNPAPDNNTENQELTANEITIEGIKAIGDLRADLPKDWASAKQHWETVLNKLLHDFLEGHSEIDYRDSSALNYNKELQYLNRLYDQNRLKQPLKQQ